MEDYLKCMKTLRSQMNDVEDQAAQISAEEHMYITTVQTLDKDLNSGSTDQQDFVQKCILSDAAKDEVRVIKEEADQMMKLKGEICTQILEKQRKIVSLESDSTTLNQSLELIHQERESLAEKLVNRRMYYSKVKEDLTSQLKEQQAWIRDHKTCSPYEKGLEGAVQKPYEIEDSENDVLRSLKDKLDAAKLELDRLIEQKSKLVSDSNETKESINLVRRRISEFKAELREMDTKVLQMEFQALQSDKCGEIEYLQSLQLQNSKLKDISHSIKCSCGVDFKVDMKDA